MQSSPRLLSAVLAMAVGAISHPAWGQSRDGRDWSRETARAVPDWARDAVVYEVFPRAFSADGNLAGVIARLDHVRDLGATVVWLMPIHPIGRDKRKGIYGSPYSIRDYDAVNPDYGTGEREIVVVSRRDARKLRDLEKELLDERPADRRGVEAEHDVVRVDVLRLAAGDHGE